MRKLISERWNEFSESILEEAVRRGSCAIVEQYRPEMDEGPLEKIGYAAAEFYLDSLVLYVFGGRIRY